MPDVSGDVSGLPDSYSRWDAARVGSDEPCLTLQPQTLLLADLLQHLVVDAPRASCWDCPRVLALFAQEQR